MKKVFAFVLLMGGLFYTIAAEIKITVDQQDSISQNEIDAVTKLMASRRMRITHESALKILKDNKLLANAFLKEKQLSSEINADISVLLNEKLANLKINNTLKNKPLTHEVLLSFYKDNLVDFYQNKKIIFSIYSFDNFDNSLDFYTKYKDNIEAIANSDINISKESQTLLLKNFHPDLANLMRDNNTTGYITPPQKFYKKYVLLHVKEFIDAGIEKFETVEAEIKKIVQKKIRYDTKKELLNSYQKIESL